MREIGYHVYFDEFFELLQQINKRKIGEWRMQLAITQNPHVKDPKQLWAILEAEDRYKNTSEKLDKSSFALLKDKMRQSTRIMVK